MTKEKTDEEKRLEEESKDLNNEESEE